MQHLDSFGDMNLNLEHFKQAVDSIAGNSPLPVPKKFFNYHKLLFTAIYN